MRPIPLVKPPKVSSAKANSRQFPRARIHRDEWAGSTDRGVPFLDQNPNFAALYPNARLLVEVGWGQSPIGVVNNWTDISSDVQMTENGLKAISISPFGRSDATSQTQPSGCTFQLDNRSGDYSRGVQSLNYPNVKLNVPVRVSISLTGFLNDYQTVFQGNIWSFKPSWDTTGNYAVVDVSASGALRRLQQGNSPLQSPLTRSVLGATTVPIAYWTIEDGSNSQQAASALPGGSPLIQAPGYDLPTFASVTAADGSDKLPNFTTSDGSGLVGSVPVVATDNWSFSFILNVGTSTGSTAIIPVYFTTTDGRVWGVQVNAPSSRWGMAYGINSSNINTIGSTPTFASTLNPFDGQPHLIRVTAQQSGADVLWHLIVDDSFTIDFDFVSSVTLAPLSRVWVNSTAVPSPPGPPILAIGHVTAYSTYVPSIPNMTLAMNGWVGETATARLTRLCNEQGVPISITGTSATIMGLQGIDTFVNLLRECETADIGTLGDGDGSGLYFITHSAKYNQTTTMALDATQGDVVPSFQPEGDDQKILNKWTVSRKNGSSATFSDDTGPLGTAAIGAYDSSVTVNTSSDSVLPSIAAWLVHLGTVDGYRYPTITLDFANQIPAKTAAFLGMLPGNRFEIDNVASYATQHPNEVVDLLAEGWTIQLSRFAFTATLNCSPADPWNVGVLGQNVKLEMAGQTLASDLLPGAITLSLATATGHCLFTTTATYPTDFTNGIYLNVGGWRVKCTASVGASSPQTLTIDASPNTQTIPAGTTVTLWKPVSLAL